MQIFYSELEWADGNKGSDQLNKHMVNIFLLPVAFLVISSFFYLGNFPPFSRLVFDYSLIGFAIYTLIRAPSLPSITLLISIFLYIFICYLLALSVDTSTRDFAIAYKSFYLLGCLVAFSLGKFLNWKKINRFVGFLLFSAFIVYLCEYLAFKAFGRPSLFTENNFEIAAFCILYYFLSLTGRPNFLYFILISIIVLLSGSFSGLATLVFITFLIHAKLKISHIFLCAILTAIGLVIFTQMLDARLERGSIDRLIFAELFWYELRSWDVFNFAFGTSPLTPLRAETCNALSYYSVLFSRDNLGQCYSVILHSYILRVIFDHGLIGLIFSGFVIFWSLRGHSLRVRFGLIGIVFLNGLSVSSLNSSVVVWALAICASCASPLQERRYHSKSVPHVDVVKS